MDSGDTMPSWMKVSVPLLAALGGVWAHDAAAAQDTVPPHVSFTIESVPLGETRRINVYTPPRYTPDARYPVVYMPDGGVEEDFPHVAATVDAGIRAGEMRPVIVVGIENTERRRDMTGPTEVQEDRAIAPRVGGSAAFRRFIAEELIPEIGRRYKLTGESAIIGESLAGLFVVETFVLQPELFDVYIAISPSLWWNGGALVRTAGERTLVDPAGTETKDLLLYSANEENIAPFVTQMVEVLRVKEAGAVRSLPNGGTVPLLIWRAATRRDLTHATIYRAVAPGVLRDVFKPVIIGSTLTPQQFDRTDTIAGPSAQVTVRSQAVGALTVYSEESRRRVQHGRRVFLAFTSPDRRVQVDLRDNGVGLTAGAESPGCTVRQTYLQYGYENDDHLFQAMVQVLDAVVEHCGSSLDDPAGYQRMLKAAEPDFSQAMQRMRARVGELFGENLERCNAPDVYDGRVEFSPSFPCSRS
jgi:predicted alpha/beta superfamily hydrolase